MSFAVKTGVTGVIRDEMRPAVFAVQNAWARHNLGVPTLTSVQDGDHGPNSLHAQGLAHDWRLNDLPAALHMVLRNEIASEVGSDFDVLVEYPGAPKTSTTWPGELHLHIEFDPRRSA